MVGESGKQVFCQAAGYAQLEPVRIPARTDTVYDLASLTKVVATTTAVFLLRDSGAIRLDQSAADFIPLGALGNVTLAQLLRHTAGFTASNRFYKLVSTTDELISWYASEGFDVAPGNRYQYDDAGFIILGKVIEVAALQPLDDFCRREIFRPLAMHDTAFNPGPELAARCAATELCAWRKLTRTPLPSLC